MLILKIHEKVNFLRLGKDVADFVDVIHSDAAIKPTVVHLPPLTGVKIGSSLFDDFDAFLLHNVFVTLINQNTVLIN